jgi:tetratricopeptide (TPR) repeat protein
MNIKKLAVSICIILSLSTIFSACLVTPDIGGLGNVHPDIGDTDKDLITELPQIEYSEYCYIRNNGTLTAPQKIVYDLVYTAALEHKTEVDITAAHLTYYSDVEELKKDLSYYQAEAHMKLEEYEEAIEIYNGLIAESEKDSIPYVMKAYCLIGMEEAESAASVYKEGYEKTKNSEFLYYLANQYVTMEQYEDALNIIHTYQHTKEESVGQRLAFLEIVVYEKQQQYDKAYELAVSYCEKYPDDAAGQKEKTFLESRR